MRTIPRTTRFVCLLTLAVSVVGVTAADAEQMGREPWRFKILDNPLSLSKAIAIEQKEEGGFGTRVRNSTEVYSYSSTTNSTSAENFTEVISNCGNNASCAVDAAVSRDGAGSTQTSSANSNDAAAAAATNGQ